MKRNNKKGFTIVELVIVIAVIGILAAVLIPTFSGIIKSANDSAALQEARNYYSTYLSEHAGDADFVVPTHVCNGTNHYDVSNGYTTSDCDCTTKPAAGEHQVVTVTP